MRIIAIASQKGGTGKTTTTRALGAEFSKLDKSVLMIDIDPQASLTVSCGINAPGKSIAEVLAGSMEIEEIIQNVSEGLDLVPSDIALAQTELVLVGMVSRENRLKRALRRQSYDYILIDCPPSLGLLTVNALVAAQEVLIPAKPEYLGLRALSLLLETLTEIRTELNKKLLIIGIVPTFYNSRLLHHAEIIEEWRDQRLPIMNTMIRQTVRAAEAPVLGESITDYATGSPVSKAYIELARVLNG